MNNFNGKLLLNMSSYYLLATRRNMLILTGIWAVFYFAFGKIFSTLSGNIPDVMFHYTSNELSGIFQAWGSDGRSVYLKGSLMLDYIYPLVYGSWLSFGIYLLSGLRKLALMPWLISILDLFENVSILILLTMFPKWNYTLATISGYITSTKWIIAFTVLSVILVLIIIKAYSAVFRKQAG